MGECNLTPESKNKTKIVYGWMTSKLMGDWKLMLLLEGGYNIIETSLSIRHCISSMLFGENNKMSFKQEINHLVQKEVDAVVKKDSWSRLIDNLSN